MLLSVSVSVAHGCQAGLTNSLARVGATTSAPNNLPKVVACDESNTVDGWMDGFGSQS